MCELPTQGLHYLFGEGLEEIHIFGMKGVRLDTQSVVLDQVTEREQVFDSATSLVGECLDNLPDQSEVDYLFLSASVAIALFVEGTIRPADFVDKIEDDNSIFLMGVEIDGVKYRVMIREDFFAGDRRIAAVGKDGQVL